MEDRFACAWPHADRWLSVDDIAAYLGIKRDTVYRWISERNMPEHKIGRLWKFRKEEIDEWVKSSGAGDQRQDDRWRAENR
jgi:excisionase family DNA binding protein